MATGSSMRKRLFEEDEFENVSEMHQLKCAKVHGFIASLSPMKTNAAWTTKYFHGVLTDGKSNKRVVGFDAKIHQKCNSFRERNEPVAVSNCEVKQSNYTSDLEIVVRKSSNLQKSPTKYEDVDVTKFKSDAEDDIVVTLNELPCLQRVTVKIKVIDVSDAGKKKDLLKSMWLLTLQVHLKL